MPAPTAQQLFLDRFHAIETERATSGKMS